MEFVVSKSVAFKKKNLFEPSNASWAGGYPVYLQVEVIRGFLERSRNQVYLCAIDAIAPHGEIAPAL